MVTIIQLDGIWSEQLGFYGITDNELAVLSEHQTFFNAYSTSIAKDFFSATSQHVFLNGIIQDNSSFERIVEGWASYIRSLGSGTINETYVQYRQKIGQVHAHIGLSPLWFMGGVANFLQLIKKYAQQSGEIKSIFVCKFVSR